MPNTTAKKNVESKVFKADRGSGKYYFLYFVTYTLIALILWPLIDLIFSAINNQPFEYSIVSDLITPVIFGVVFTLIEMLYVSIIKKKD